MDNDRTEMKDILEGDKNQGDKTIEIHHGTDRGVGTGCFTPARIFLRQTIFIV